MSQLEDPALWDAAAQYQRVVHPFTAAFARRALDETALPPAARVIDVACGTGALALMAAAADARVLATDFSPGMVARVAEAGHPGVEARVLDGQALDLPDAGFDAAFSIFGVILFPDWRAGLAEMARVVRPGGTGTIATWAHGDGAAINMALADIARRLAPDIASPPPPPGMAELRTPERLTAALEAAGFADLRVVEHTHPFTMPVDDLASERPFAFSPWWPLLTPGRQAAVRAELHTSAIDGHVHIPSTALIAVGRRA